MSEPNRGKTQISPKTSSSSGIIRLLGSKEFSQIELIFRPVLMEKESKASTLKSDQKVIVLRSVAQYLERCGFSKCFKKLLSEAEIEVRFQLNSCWIRWYSCRECVIFCCCFRRRNWIVAYRILMKFSASFLTRGRLLLACFLINNIGFTGWLILTFLLFL